MTLKKSMIYFESYIGGFTMNNMTKHIQKRMNQRCINEAMLHIVQNFGDHSPNGERIILNNKNLLDLEKWARHFLRQVELMKQRGGLTLALDDESLITVFANNSYSKNLKKGANQ